MANQQWTREQTLIALNLYCQLTFGQLHRRNPLIITTALMIERTPDALAMKLANLASLDPAITNSGRKGLVSCSKLDREIWHEFMEHPNNIGEESQLLIDAVAQKDNTLSTLSSHDPDLAIDTDSFYAGDSTRIVKTRIKQAFFRKAVLSSYNHTCCMTGISLKPLLIASHIVPWSHNENQRLNPANGLCLSALHDKAYDVGLITVTPDFRIKISQQLKSLESSAISQDYLIGLEGQLIKLPKKFQPNPEFLAYHMENIFLKP